MLQKEARIRRAFVSLLELFTGEIQQAKGLEIIIVNDGSIDNSGKVINDWIEKNKNIDYNIFKALDNINLNCVLGYKRDGNYKSFLILKSS